MAKYITMGDDDDNKVNRDNSGVNLVDPYSRRIIKQCKYLLEKCDDPQFKGEGKFTNEFY